MGSFSEMIEAQKAHVDFLMQKRIGFESDLALGTIYFIFLLLNLVRRRKEVHVEI